MPDIAILFKTSDKTPMVLEEKHIQMIRDHNPNGEVRAFETEEEMLATDFDPEVLISWGQFVPNTFCNRCTNLKWIQGISAGVEGLMSLDVAKKIPVTKMAGVHGVPMSETTMCYILYFLHSFPQIMANQRKHYWKKPENPAPTEAMNKTVAILGMGAIGSEVARKCKFFGMKVIGCKRTPTPMEYVDEMYSTAEMDKVLGMADFVVCLIPHSPESEKTFGAEQFAQMKNNAVFISIGRGKVIDFDALVDALNNGTIAGAALDALDPEPLNEDSPLWDMENVVITPHCSADSPYYFDRAFEVMCENLDRYVKGEELLHLVR